MSHGDGTHNVLSGTVNIAVQARDIHGDVVVVNAPAEYQLHRYQRTERPVAGQLLDQPSQLLDPRLAVVEFTGREDELRGLAEWRDADAGPSALWLHGPGGQGKTRLANAFAEECQQAGWTVVEATRQRGRGSHDVHPDGGAGLLVVVDYADRWPLTQLGTLFDGTLLRPDLPVKLLLLARTRSPWPSVRADLRRRGAGSAIMALPALSGDRLELFTVARDSFAARYGIADRGVITPPGGLDGPDFDLTLAVHMAALVAVDSRHRKQHGGHLPTDLAGLSAYLLDREHLLWAQRYGEERATTLGRTVFVAALTGGLPRDDAKAVLAGVGLADVLDQHRDCYPPADQNRVLEPLHPDRLAEDFLALSLPGHDHQDYGPDDWAATALHTLLGAPDAPPGYSARALTFLAAAAARWPHVSRDHLVPLLRRNPALVAHGDSAALITLAELDLPVELLTSLDGQLPHRRTDLDVGIAAFTRVRVDRQLATATDPAERGQLYFDLACREHHAGRDREALPAAEESVRIWEELAASDPGRENRVAAALNLLSVVLSDVGRTAEALECAGRGVDLCRRLVERDPDEYRRLLAEVLLLRGSHLSDLGRYDEALADGDEAVALLGKLVETNPEWEFTYADALHNLGVHLAQCGRHDEATAPIQQAVDGYYRKFAVQDPGTYRPALALGLSSLAAASMLGRFDGSGLPFAVEAVAIFHDLVELNPAYRPGLADALVVLASLRWVSGDRSQARATAEEAEEAAALHRALAEANPARRPKLAAALMNLGEILSTVGEHDGAIAASVESVAVYRGLVASDLSGYEQGLAAALNNLATRLTAVDRRPEALAAVSEAVAIHRRGTGPASERFLAMTLPNLALLQTGFGRHAEAVDHAREAVAIMRRRNESPSVFALALNVLGTTLSSAGRPDEAAAALREAVAVQGQEAGANPSFLAQSLRELGAALGTTGDHEQALSAVEQAVELYQRLADTDPRHEPGLAAAWQDLGLFRWRVGQRDQALAATERAVALRRSLAARDQSQRLGVTGALNNLALFLAATGRRAEAVDRAREKAEVFRGLAEDDPDRFQPSALGQLLGQWTVRNLPGPDTAALLSEITTSVEIDLEAARGLPPAQADDVRTTLSSAAEVYAEHGHTRIADEIRRRLASG